MQDIRGTDQTSASDPAQGVLARLLHLLGHVTFRHDVIYNQFFAHATSCNCSDADPAGNGFSLLRIADLATRAQQLAADLRECDNWACSILCNA